MHEIKREIIKQLMYKPGARFSELKMNYVDSNKLAYHLKQLEKVELIENKLSKYYLTNKGKKLLNFIKDGSDEARKQPVCVVVLIPIDKGKVLLQKRLKEPWIGYWLLVAGKIRFGESFKEAIKRELLEETGLSGEPKFIGMASSRSYDKGKLVYHVHMYCYKVSKMKGILIDNIKEGKNRWFKFSGVSRLKMHPLDHWIFTKRDEKWMIEQEEYFEDERLLKSRIKEI